MKSREDNVLDMQITLVKVMSEEWNISHEYLSEILDKYDVLSYIDVCHEEFNSMGELGIIEDIEEYIKLQGGEIYSSISKINV